MHDPEGKAERRRGLFAWLFTLAGSLALASLTILAPLLRARAPRASALIYAVFAPLCHQVPERCLYAAGFPFAVCGRCFGIYLGFFLGAAAYPLIRGFVRPRPPGVATLVLATLPLAADVGGTVLGLWDGPMALRFATGLVWGSVLPGYFIAGLAEAAAALPRLRPFRRRGRA